MVPGVLVPSLLILSAISSIAFSNILYCFSKSLCNSIKLFPKTFQWNFLVLVYSTIASDKTDDNTLVIIFRFFSLKPMLGFMLLSFKLISMGKNLQLLFQITTLTALQI